MRIAIVNDSAMALEALRRVISSEPHHEVAWTAVNGADAVERARNDTPDLILMDLFMPVMDGVEATRQIMQHSPCAILVVTATVEGNTDRVFEAMGAGAVDAVNTPVLESDSGDAGSHDLLRKIRIVGSLIDKNPKQAAKAGSRRDNLVTASDPRHALLAIGSSTGGPAALARILGELPQHFPAPVVIVQHVDEQFVEGLAQWLDSLSHLPVRMARHGDHLEPGTVLLSNTDRHIALNNDRQLVYSEGPKDYPYRPSVNVFFDSVAKNRKGAAVGLLLTGMGKDGATGLLAMRQAGFETIAQSKEDCAVFGMPKAAIDLDAAKTVLPLTDIPRALCRYYKVDHADPLCGDKLAGD